MTAPLPVELGIVEGYYGRPWSWEARREVARWLGGHGLSFYLYAPKADARLRREWREPHSPEERRELAALSEACREAGVRFGVGLSPYEIFLGFDQAARSALADKLAFVDDLGVADLAVLFDDMRGDVKGLAERQAEVVAWCRSRTAASRMFVCPSYYTDDPTLDRVFGDRPQGYLERLGEALDDDVRVFWTGPEVVSRELTPGHLERVADTLGRKPFLWDNYPVNDGERMSRYLHVRGVSGRPAELAELVAGHAVNPALQPVLTRIPLLTLVDSYREGPAYDYGRATLSAARRVLGEHLGTRLWEDLLHLQDTGLDRLGEKEAELRARWEGEAHPGAREVVAWLDGEYAMSDEEVETQ